MLKSSFSAAPLAAFSLAALFAVATATSAVAAQAWYCICKGETKRYLASTRHCEVKSGVPKGKWCTKAQWRAVYGPACAEMGCKLKQ